jgi:tetratricopeptide (TPR) repeat protein
VILQTEVLMATAVDHQLAGRLAEAEETYRQILTLDPEHASATHNLGVIAYQLGHYERAAELIGQVIARHGSSADYHWNLGMVLERLGRTGETIAAMKRAVTLLPTAPRLRGLADRLLESGQIQQADGFYRQALACAPDDPDTLSGFGEALRRSGKHAEARTILERALTLAPQSAEAASNLGATLYEMGMVPAAEAHFRRALVCNPRYPNAYSNLGELLRRHGYVRQALSPNLMAAELQPRNPIFHDNLGNTLRDLGKLQDAEARFRRAVEIAPDFGKARANLGMLDLLRGDFARGWEGYEGRMQAELAALADRFTQPRWHPDRSGRGSTVLLHAEQGLGDTLQFVRYVPQVIAAGFRVVLEVQKPLVGLLGCIADVVVVGKGDPLPDFDSQCPLLSLPLVFGTALKTIPAAIPYLSADPDAVERWRSRLRGSGLKVGIAWAGNPAHRNDATRSMPLAALQPLLSVPGVRFFVLQKELRPGDQESLARLGVENIAAEFRDFTDTAAAVSNLDLTVSVDTSIVHLAGALGRPVWIMLPGVPDWRWLLECDDSPWYPTARLFRQPNHADWTGVAETVARELAALASGEQAAHTASPPVILEDPAIDIDAELATALSAGGVQLRQQGRFGDALENFERALALKPDSVEAWNDRGLTLQDLKRGDEALASLDTALVHRPDHPDVHNNRGNVLQELGRLDESVLSYDRAIALQPLHATAMRNRADALRSLERHDEALTGYDASLALEPDAAAFTNRGNALRELGRYAEAIDSYGRAIAMQPEYALAHLNKGLCHLVMADFAPGWNEFEWRWKATGQAFPPRGFAQPMLAGRKDIAGRRVLLHAEQGLGDTLLFCRYAPLVAARGGQVILEVQPQLKSLLQGLSGPTEVIGAGEALPPFDAHCPLLTLPKVFETDLASIPAEIPYLAADAAHVAKWRARLDRARRRRIGLVWSGSATHPGDRHRSLKPARFSTLARGDIEIVGLTRDVREADREIAASLGPYAMLGSELDDFADTAALVSLMDLVITVDTSVAHLAGALGKTVWILLPYVPDWRWLLEREDTPWYPTARLFRQTRHNDWATVIERVADELHRRPA